MKLWLILLLLPFAGCIGDSDTQSGATIERFSATYETVLENEEEALDPSRMKVEVLAPIEIMNRWEELQLVYPVRITDVESNFAYTTYLDGSFREVRQDFVLNWDNQPIKIGAFVAAGEIGPFGIFAPSLIHDGVMNYTYAHEATFATAKGGSTKEIRADHQPNELLEIHKNAWTFDDTQAPKKIVQEYSFDGEWRRVTVTRVAYRDLGNLEAIEPEQLDVDVYGEPRPHNLFVGEQGDAYSTGITWLEFVNQMGEGSYVGCNLAISGSAFHFGTNYGDLWQVSLYWSYQAGTTRHIYYVTYSEDVLSVLPTHDPWSTEHSKEYAPACDYERPTTFIRSVDDLWRETWQVPFKSGGPCSFFVYELDNFGPDTTGGGAYVAFSLTNSESGRPDTYTGYQLNVGLHNDAWEYAILEPVDWAALDAGNLLNQQREPVEPIGALEGGPFCQPRPREEFPRFSPMSPTMDLDEMLAAEAWMSGAKSPEDTLQMFVAPA